MDAKKQSMSTCRIARSGGLALRAPLNRVPEDCRFSGCGPVSMSVPNNPSRRVCGRHAQASDIPVAKHRNDPDVNVSGAKTRVTASC